MSLLFCNPFLEMDPDPTQKTCSSRATTTVQAELWKMCLQSRLRRPVPVSSGDTARTANEKQFGRLLEVIFGKNINAVGFCVAEHYLSGPSFWIRLQQILMPRQGYTPQSYSHGSEVPAGMNALIHPGKHTDTANALPPTSTDKQAPITSAITGSYMKTLAIILSQGKIFFQPISQLPWKSLWCWCYFLTAPINKLDWPARPFCSGSLYVHPTPW